MTDRPRRAVRTLLAVAAAAAGALALLEALWMLLLGLSMAYGTPLGAPDSDWRVAAGVGLGAAGVLFGAGIAALALRRPGAGAAGLGAGAALYTALYLGYPGELDRPLLLAALVAPWVAALVGIGIWLAGRARARRAAPEPAAADPADAAQPA